ncbi:hypothetical protein COOONC_09095 [Cooperia oncophora]
MDLQPRGPDRWIFLYRKAGNVAEPVLLPVHDPVVDQHHRASGVVATGVVLAQEHGRATQPEDEPELRVASPTPSESLVTERETKNNFLYTVLKGNRRCTIPGTMYSKRLPDSWIRIHFMLHDEDGAQLA